MHSLYFYDSNHKPMVPLNILEKYKPLLKSYPNEHVLFNEGESAKFYFQLFEGQLQMMNLSEDGKKMVQGYFGPGDSFGEPPLILPLPLHFRNVKSLCYPKMYSSTC